MLAKLTLRKHASAPVPSVSPRSRFNDQTIALPDILGDPFLCATFKDFLIKSLAQENLLAVQAIEAFNQAKDEKLRNYLRNFIISEFLSLNATSPVNVEATVRSQTCDAIQVDVENGTSSPRDAFAVCDAALNKLLVQDCLARFVRSKDYERYKERLAEIGKLFPKMPLLREMRLRISQSFENKFSPIATMMPDLTMVQGRQGLRGSIECHNAGAVRALDMLTNAEAFNDWIPDVDSVELQQKFGSYLSCVKINLSSGISMSLGVFLMVHAVHEGYVAWETFGKSDVELSGAFCVRLCGDRFDSCHVDFFLKARGKSFVPSQFAQSVLLGLNMAISTSVETKVADLSEDLQFLKKL